MDSENQNRWTYSKNCFRNLFGRDPSKKSGRAIRYTLFLKKAKGVPLLSLTQPETTNFYKKPRFAIYRFKMNLLILVNLRKS